jgi:hypothetical protein
MHFWGPANHNFCLLTEELSRISLFDNLAKRICNSK